jgi:Calx-beta domain
MLKLYPPLVLLIASSSFAATFEPISGVEDPQIWGTQPNRGVFSCAISGDGSVVGFDTDATQLVSNDRNGLPDVFIRSGATTQKLSRRAAGGDARGFSGKLSLSSSGRFVAFRSDDDLLGDASAVTNTAFWLDRQTGIYRRASFDMAGTPVPVFTLAISGNGRYVTFETEAPNLVAADTNSDTDVYRFDSQTGAIVLVSADPLGAIANRESTAPSIDDTGNLIAFESAATNLVVGDTSVIDVFVKNLTSASVIRASQDNAGLGGNQTSFNSYLAANGNFVSFETVASNLDSSTADGNGSRDVYRHNLSSRVTQRVSVSANSGPDANNSSFDSSMSENGRYVWFRSNATDLITPAPSNPSQLYRRDMSNTTVVMASSNAVVPGAHASSSDGQSACFSTSSALQADDTNQLNDVYRTDLVTNSLVRQSIAGSVIPSAFSSQDVFLSDSGLDAARITVSGGRDLDAQSFAEFNLATRSFYVTEIVPSTGQSKVLARNASGALPDQSTRSSSCSEACVFAAIETNANNLASNDSNSSFDAYRLQTDGAGAGTLELISQGLDGNAAGGVAEAKVSGSGGFDVVFLSTASNIVAGDSNSKTDAFLWRSTGVPITRISVSSTGVQADNDTTELSMDENGTFIAFSSDASNLVSGDTNGASDVFLYQRSNATTIRVSADFNGVQLQAEANSPSISSDGRLVLFHVDNSVIDDELYLYDRVLATRRKITLPMDVVPREGTAKFARNSRYFGFVGQLGDVTIAYRYDVESSTPLRELSRTSDALFGTTQIAKALITSASTALLNTTQPLSDADRNARFDVQKLTLETGNLSFPGTTLTVSESAGTIDIPIRRLQGAEARVEANGAFTLTTAQANDFAVVEARVIWEDTISGVQNLRISIVDDSSVEPDEAFQVQLVQSGGAALGANNLLTITIADNDSDQLFKNGFE